ncbi:MAG: UDP-N-acetylglucosamine 2-epimerase (non-hydrolyzing) [Dethiobacteria bacterium]
MKVTTVIGARPQFVKASMVSRALREIGGIEEKIVHTGQHYDHNMSAVFFQELEMPPVDCYLGIGSGLHGEQTGLMMAAVEKYLLHSGPDLVLVYGDTNSTLAGALAAAKLHLPVAHVEAGLRSYNRLMPEEINRLLTDHLSDLLYVPTGQAMENLRLEGIYGEKVYLSGDVMYDASIFFGRKAEKSSRIFGQIGFTPRQYVLATIHRAENTDNPARIRAIFYGLSRIAEKYPVVMPLHPRTRKILFREGLVDEIGKELHIIDPVGYLDMLLLEKKSRLIVTDSGGVQKEAFFYRIPCVTLRDETEWGELVDAGWNRVVVPENPEVVARSIFSAMDSYGRTDLDLYGDGRASQKIAAHLLDFK